MPTSSRGGGGNIFDNRAPVVPPRQPQAKPLGPTGKVTTIPNFRGAQRGSMPAFRQMVTHLPKGPSQADLTFQGEKNAIGPAALKQASNPRIAALQQILGDATGIPSAVNAARTHNAVALAGNAAMLFPFGRIGKAIKGGVNVAKAVEDATKAEKTVKEIVAPARVANRTPEEVAQHIEQASKNAIAEGHVPLGGGVKNAPKLKPGEITPETGGELGAQVRTALKGAGSAQTKQNAIYSAARGEQVTKGLAAREAAGGGLAGHLAERAAQKGAFQKVYFNGIRDLNQETFDEMIRHVQNLPSLKPFEQGHGVDALVKLSKDQLPAPHERAILERAFGKETSNQLVQIARNGGWKTLGIDIANVPRALMASADLSAPFRQGLIASVTHPSLLAKNFGPMLKMAKNEDFYQASSDAIHNDPYYPLMRKGGLALTDIGETPGGAISLGGREEARQSNLAEHMPGSNPVSKLYNRSIGTVVRGSDRAYVGFLNKIRADYFKRMVTQVAQQGFDVNDEKVLHQVASFVNMATGRGAVPKVMQDHLATMNAAFFSPRLLASRLQFLSSPLLYSRANPVVRREALRSFISMGAMAMTVVELAKLAGASVVDDPTNADFAKIKMGNVRVDFLGGIQQPVRLGAQLYTGRITSSTTGKVIPLGSGFGQSSRWDIIQKFLQGKASPLLSLFVDYTKGKDFTGQPVKWNDLSSYEREAASHLTPFLAQDLHDLYTTSGPKGLLAGPLDLVGIGVQDYKPKPPKAKSGGNIFDSGGSSTPTPPSNIFDTP